MPDPGFASGFIGVGLQIAMDQIFHHINIACRCKEELAALKDKLLMMEPIILQIQQRRRALNMDKDKASAVNRWFKTLEALLKEASEVAGNCTIPSYNVILRYNMSKKITGLISNITGHLESSDLVVISQIQELVANVGQMTATVEAHMASASTSSATTAQVSTHAPTGSARTKLIDEPLIVGQDKALANLDFLAIDDSEARNIGVLGKGGSGKTLLLKKLFNAQKVRNHFSDGLLLWLTVSQTPFLTALRNELRAQIGIQKNVNWGENMEEEDLKIWLNETLQQSSSFALFLDDVWGENAAELLEGLGILRPVRDHSNSKVIVSSRNRSALLKMGVAEKHTITMEELIEDDSWKLFAYHAFPYNDGNPPSNIDEEKAKLVCHKCGGLPLAIKVVGRAMAGSTQQQQWEWATHSLPDANSVHDCLRLSYDALCNEDVHMQFCFLYIAATFLEDQIIHSEWVVPLWVGERLVAKNMLQVRHQIPCDPFEMARIYIDLLADRCLVEAIRRDADGHVSLFKMHDVLRDMGIRIAEEEENFYCRVGCRLTELNENECSARTRIFLTANQVSSLPVSLKAPQICSLVMYANFNLTKIPNKVIGSMISLKVLDLSCTSVQSIPESVGCLKQLVCLRLRNMPIKRLPASLIKLINLEILDLGCSSITKLPSDLYKLRSMKFLCLDHCEDLQYLPCTISRLTSLQYLLMYGNETLCKREGEHKRSKKVASINTLASLKQLKTLLLTSNEDSFPEGIFGAMTQMDFLDLTLTKMQSLPRDMTNMLKLRRLSLECSQLVKIENTFCNFKNITVLKFFKCEMLEELSHLHQLKTLRELQIFKSSKLRKFPEEFGYIGAFPMLEIFSLVELENLEEFPKIETGAMSSLKTFTIMECQALKILPKSVFTLKTLQKIRIYSCSKVMENLEKVKSCNNSVKVITLSGEDTKEAKARYLQLKDQLDSWLYGEFWSNELFLFLRSLDRF